MSRAHARGYIALPDVELVACADIAPQALSSFGEEFGVSEEHRYLSYREMMDVERPDLVSICSLHHQHAEMTIEAAQFAPEGILCEKPIAVSLGEADAMIDACEKAGTVLIVGHQRRYMPQYVAAYKALHQGTIGELVSMESHGHHHSSLMVDGTHTVDLLRWYAGDKPISWVMGQVDFSEGRRGWGTPIENAALLMFGFEDELRAYHTNGGMPKESEWVRTALWPQAQNYHLIILRGTEGEIHIDGDRQREGIPLVKRVQNGHVTELPLPEYELPVHARVIRDLITAIGTGAPHTLDCRSARATLEVLMAAYESSRRRAWISLPLQVKENPLFDMLGQVQSE
jgi:UDP-N-acetylglucosamine 3-dehydrogenase